jgi:hypothetical protein
MYEVCAVLIRLVNIAEIQHNSLQYVHNSKSWLQIHRSGFDSRRYQIFWEVVGLERGPLDLVSTTEELLERKVTVPV